jgi:glycosidase
VSSEASRLKPVIYQLVVRYFGNTKLVNKVNGTIKENGCGKFGDINESALREIKNLGCTHIWLTGCIRQATLTGYPEIGLPADDADIVKGLAGSMYAISDYYDVCPDYANEPANRMLEFEKLVSRIHDNGLKVIIDFVPNHVARSYESTVRPERSLGAKDDQSKFFVRDNNFYYLTDPPNQTLKLVHPEHWNPANVSFDGRFAKENGTINQIPKATGNNVTSASPPVDAWYECIKLNYGFNFVTGETAYNPVPKTWDDMDHILEYWQTKKVDGFRCDFAHYVPAEAWRFLIEQARSSKRNPQTYFMAEAYPWKGSGDPITEKVQLIDAGFDAIYHGESYQQLKKIYQGHGSLDDYGKEMNSLSERERAHAVNYIENHDEVRVAAPIKISGFGSLNANYQLLPLQFLYGHGAAMILNGQEVGEPGEGNKGFSTEDGRTSIFDYWCMPELAKWTNEHKYDGAQLSQDQKQLRKFIADLQALCQDQSIRGSGYWGLRYHNRNANFPDSSDELYSFARYEPFSSRLILVVANFSGDRNVTARLRIPTELASAVHLNQDTEVKLLLDEGGSCKKQLTKISRTQLISNGILVTVKPQTSQVIAVE